MIISVSGDKALVCAGLHNPSVAQAYYLVSVAHSAQSVCYEDDGSSAVEVCQIAYSLSLSLSASRKLVASSNIIYCGCR